MNLDKQIRQSVHALQQGGVIAYPTESVFGLGCDPDTPDAVQRILALKQRPIEKGLILIAASFDQVKKYLQPVSPDIQQRVFATWPGPHTWLWPVNDDVPELLRGHYSTLAIRVSAHPVVQQICNSLGKAIVSTSANPAGKPPACNADEIRQYFDERLDFIIDTGTGECGSPTEIRDAMSNRIIRPA